MSKVQYQAHVRGAAHWHQHGPALVLDPSKWVYLGHLTFMKCSSGDGMRWRAQEGRGQAPAATSARLFSG
jgi:hypothetical protein